MQFDRTILGTVFVEPLAFILPSRFSCLLLKHKHTPGRSHPQNYSHFIAALRLLSQFVICRTAYQVTHPPSCCIATPTICNIPKTLVNTVSRLTRNDNHKSTYSSLWHQNHQIYHVRYIVL